MSAYPEHDKIKALAGKNQVVGDFLEWLTDRCVIAQWSIKTACNAKREYPRKRAWKCVDGQLIAEEFNIYHEPGSKIGQCPDCEGTGLIDRMVPILERTNLRTEQLLALYFEIDLEKLVAEKDQILKDFEKELNW